MSVLSFWIAVPPNSLNIRKCSPGLLFVSLYLNPLLSRRSKFSNDCCHLNVTWSCREMRDRNCSLVVNSCGFTVRNLRVPNPLQKFRNAQTPEPMITHIQGLNSAGSRRIPDPTAPSWNPAPLFGDPAPKLGDSLEFCSAISCWSTLIATVTNVHLNFKISAYGFSTFW